MDFNSIEWVNSNLDSFLGGDALHQSEDGPSEYTFSGVDEAQSFVKENFYKVSKEGSTFLLDKKALINKADRDYWQIEAEENGGIVVKRLIDPEDPQVEF